MFNAQTLAFDETFLMKHLMGPNCVTMVKELTDGLPLHGARILDLGCGTGLTSMVLAARFGAQVFATDLWIGAGENHARFHAAGLDRQIVPIHADANALPYADGYFDAAVSVDAYLYFGADERFMDEKLAPLVKKGGVIALAFPGVKEELGSTIPAEMLRSWTPEDLREFHSCGWWDALLGQSAQIEVQSIREMDCFEQSWADWIKTDNPYAVHDRPAMEAGAGKYMNLISVIAHKK